MLILTEQQFCKNNNDIFRSSCWTLHDFKSPQFSSPFHVLLIRNEIGDCRRALRSQSENLLRKDSWKENIKACLMLSCQKLTKCTLKSWCTFNLISSQTWSSSSQMLSKHLAILSLVSLWMIGAYHHTLKQLKVSI